MFADPLREDLEATMGAAADLDYATSAADTDIVEQPLGITGKFLGRPFQPLSLRLPVA